MGMRNQRRHFPFTVCPQHETISRVRSYAGVRPCVCFPRAGSDADFPNSWCLIPFFLFVFRDGGVFLAFLRLRLDSQLCACVRVCVPCFPSINNNAWPAIVAQLLCYAAGLSSATRAAFRIFVCGNVLGDIVNIFLETGIVVRRRRRRRRRRR